MPPVSRTCQSCADSKVRCVRDPESAPICNRCHRLGRDCQYRQTGRRFNGFQKDRKIAALESQINGLMVGRALTEDNDSTGTRSKSSVDGDAAPEDIISRGFLDLDTAERYLSAFKTVLTPQFPFVVVPPDVSAKRLRQEKPFLCLAILASASYENMPLQRTLGAEFKKVVASRIVVNGEISFEFLQGLLVFLAWSHYHSRPHRYTQFLQLAISLVIDLRLDRPPRTEEWKTALRFKPQEDLQNRALNRLSWGSDEQRAVLGCYYLSSSIALLVQKKSTVQRLPYHEDCCKFLQEANEYPHDKYITYVIQLQFIAEKIDQLSAKHLLELEKPGSGLELYVTNLKSDLEALYRNLPFNINESALLALQYHATGLCLYQLALNISSQQPRSYFDSPSWKDDLSVSALVSASSILELLIQLPPNLEVGYNNTQWVQMGFALLVAYRHTVAASRPDQTAAFFDTLSKLQLRIGALSTSDVDSKGCRDAFFDFEKRVIQIQKWLGGLSRPESNSRSQEDSQVPQETPFSGFTGPDIFLGGPQDFNAPLGDVFSPENLQVPHDLLFSSSFEQVMADWV